MRRVLVRWFLALCAGCGMLVALADGPVTRLDVTSQPEGASVIVDGKDRGVTPLQIFDLKPGDHHLKCRMTGYVDQDRIVKLEAGRPVSRSFAMDPELGLLLVKSEPEGCNIIIDGVSVGETPRLVTTLTSKDVHRVELRKTGYRSSTFEVRFDGRRPQLRLEKLVLDSGTIEIVSEPADADVTVNGIARGKAPLTVTDIPKGRAVVRFQLEGFSEETRELSVNAGDRQFLAVAMKGLPGTLSLSSVPAGARFYVNDQIAGTSPVVLRNLKPGTYDIRAELEGYGTLARSVKIDNGTSAREEFRLSNVMGRLEIRTMPPGATVYLDAKVIGVTKSADAKAEMSDVLAVDNLAEGEHFLKVVKEGFSESVRHPKIRSQKTSQANVKLKRIFKPNVEVVTDSGTYPGVLIDNSPEFVTIEVSLGIQRSFPREEIRKLNFLKARK